MIHVSRVFILFNDFQWIKWTLVFSNAHFYKWGVVHCCGTQSKSWEKKGYQTSKHGSRKQRRDRRSGGPTHRRSKQRHNPAASVGRLYILPIRLPWKSTIHVGFHVPIPMDASWEFTKNHQNFMRHKKRLSGDFIKVFSLVGSWTFVNFISMVCWQKWGETAIFRPNWKIHP